MFDVDYSCPYLCNDCFELGCAFCNIHEQLAAMDDDDLEEHDD